jgi:catechol 2,3-dioxygenase-like lactoylglutathione lyase family enzyme
MIKSFDHFTITVTDMERSIKFYRDILGLPVLGKLVKEDGIFVYLKLGTGMIELFEFNNKGKPYQVKELEDIGIQHLGLKVDSVDEVTERLKKEDVKFVVEPRSVDGVRLAFFKDPDGIFLEIMEGELDLLPYE